MGKVIVYMYAFDNLFETNMGLYNEEKDVFELLNSDGNKVDGKTVPAALFKNDAGDFESKQVNYKPSGSNAYIFVYLNKSTKPVKKEGTVNSSPSKQPSAEIPPADDNKELDNKILEELEKEKNEQKRIIKEKVIRIFENNKSVPISVDELIQDLDYEYKKMDVQSALISLVSEGKIVRHRLRGETVYFFNY